jgi:hypothetical protein
MGIIIWFGLFPLELVAEFIYCWDKLYPYGWDSDNTEPIAAF